MLLFHLLDLILDLKALLTDCFRIEVFLADLRHRMSLFADTLGLSAAGLYLIPLLPAGVDAFLIHISAPGLHSALDLPLSLEGSLALPAAPPLCECRYTSKQKY
jgi:hypothetical protein